MQFFPLIQYSNWTLDTEVQALSTPVDTPWVLPHHFWNNNNTNNSNTSRLQGDGNIKFHICNHSGFFPMCPWPCWFTLNSWPEENGYSDYNFFQSVLEFYPGVCSWESSTTVMVRMKQIFHRVFQKILSLADFSTFKFILDTTYFLKETFFVLYYYYF